MLASCNVGAAPAPNGPSGVPSACPSPNLSYPPQDCAQFTTAGTETVTYTRTFPTPTPLPTTIDYTLSANATVHARQSFHGQVATQFATLEVASSALQTITTTDDIYYVFPTTGNILDIGYHSTDSNGVVLDVQNLSGNGIVGQFPGFAASWNNTAAQVVSEMDPDGTATTQTFNADGSYTLNKTEAAGTTTATENSDGSGTATIPSTGFFGFVGTGTTLSISTPSPGLIIYTLSSVGAPAPTPTPIVIPVPAWYPVNPVLASDTTTNLGSATIPVSCQVPPALGTTAIHLHELRTALDTIFGTSEQETSDQWVAAPVGPVCDQIADVISTYYDFSGQSVPIVSSVPVQVTTTDETIGLQTALRSALARNAQSLASARIVFATQLAIAETDLQRVRLKVRDQQLKAMADFVRRRVAR